MTPADPRVWIEMPSDLALADFLARCHWKPQRKRIVVYPVGGVCPPEHRHGENLTCWSHGCRCPECRDAQREHQFWRRNHTQAGYAPEAPVPARGSRRRLEALMALGWPASDLARRLQVSPQRIHQWLREDVMMPATTARIAALFDELWDQRPAPSTSGERHAVTKALSFAASRGFALPLEWNDIDADEHLPVPEPVENDYVDDAAVALAIAGEVVSLTPADRRAAVKVLHRERLNDYEIAARLRCSDRTVFRIRHELGLPEVFGQIEWRPRPSEGRAAA